MGIEPATQCNWQHNPALPLTPTLTTERVAGVGGIRTRSVGSGAHNKNEWTTERSVEIGAARAGAGAVPRASPGFDSHLIPLIPLIQNEEYEGIRTPPGMLSARRLRRSAGRALP